MDTSTYCVPGSKYFVFIKFHLHISFIRRHYHNLHFTCKGVEARRCWVCTHCHLAKNSKARTWTWMWLILVLHCSVITHHQKLGNFAFQAGWIKSSNGVTGWAGSPGPSLSFGKWRKQIPKRWLPRPRAKSKVESGPLGSQCTSHSFSSNNLKSCLMFPWCLAELQRKLRLKVTHYLMFLDRGLRSLKIKLKATSETGRVFDILIWIQKF